MITGNLTKVGAKGLGGEIPGKVYIGIQGSPGKTPELSVGDVETLPPESPATVEITGTKEKPILNFGIPQGRQGEIANLDEKLKGYAKTEDIPTDKHIIDLIEENAPECSGGGISVTGAKVGQTVKIAEVDENGVPTVWEAVEFPGDKEYELIETIVCDGTFGSISRTNLSLKRAKLYINTKAGTEATAVNIRGYNDSGLFSNAYISSGVHTTDRFYSVVFVSDGKDAYVENTGSSAASYSASGLYRTAYRQNADTPIKMIDIVLSGGVLSEGSIIEIWGVRA